MTKYISIGFQVVVIVVAIILVIIYACKFYQNKKEKSEREKEITKSLSLQNGKNHTSSDAEEQKGENRGDFK